MANVALQDRIHSTIDKIFFLGIILSSYFIKEGKKEMLTECEKTRAVVGHYVLKGAYGLKFKEALEHIFEDNEKEEGIKCRSCKAYLERARKRDRNLPRYHIHVEA